MAKLIAVCRDEEYPFDRRQIPLMIEESLTMVMEIPETNISSEFISTAEVSQFFKRYSCLSQSEMNAALMVWQKQLFKLIAVSVPCVGCRRSVERLYNQLWKSGQPAIEPLVIHASGILTLTDSFLSDSKLIYALFYIHGPHLNDVVDLIPKSRRNRRCLLHSLETHKARASGWIDVWDLLSQECRDEVVLIDSDLLLDTLDNYLRKHRFCTECKSKVLKAYNILSGDIEGDTENGYCAALYEGLKSCPKERHIHVVCDTEFIANLIGRAEPELAGGRRERHARTIDIAQEEVLTCLGIHLWERLHRLWQKLRAEEQTWQMLFYLGVEALRKNFETAVEEKQGITQLELVVEEISEAERVKEQRKENKRMKKKKRKENKAKLIQEEEKVEKAVGEEEDEEEKSANSEYSESLDGSEKSSNDSQISPRKTDEEDAISCSPPEESCLTKSPSPKSTSPKCAKKESPVAPLTTVVENNKPCPPKKESTCDANESTEKSKCPIDPPKVSCNKKINNNKSKCVTKEPVENKAKCSETNNGKPAKCNSKDVVTQQKSCENKDILINKPKPCQPEVVKDTRPWEVVKESKYCPSSDKKRNNNKTDQSNNSSVKPCTENNQKSSKHVCADANPPQQQNSHHYQSSSYCKCDEENKPACRRQNGYHDYGNRSSSCGDQKGGKQRNSFPICRSCQPNVGPRFNRHDDQQRYSSTSDVYDKCYSINNARGGNRGKRKGVKQKESFGGNNGGSNGVTTNHHNCSPHHHHNHHHPPSSQQPVRHQHRHSPEDNPAVEDADELRLLKMMGWNAEESTNIAEKDIADFAANRLELETRRQELRDRLRSQFQKMSVNPVRLTGIQL